MPDSLRDHLQNLHLPQHLRHKLPILVPTRSFNRRLGNQCPIRVVFSPLDPQLSKVNKQPNENHTAV